LYNSFQGLLHIV